MKRKIIYNEGDRFKPENSKLTFIEELDHIVVSKQNKRMTLVKCDCGNVFSGLLQHFVSGNTISCGCVGSGKHNLYNHSAYTSWRGMKRRCMERENYKRKNIYVHWIWNVKNPEGCKNFCQWWDQNHPGIVDYTVTIERVDNNKGYYPENCTLIPLNQQMYNRNIRIDNKSGYIGVWKKRKKWIASLKFEGKSIINKTCDSKKIALLERNKSIIENNLQNKYKIQEWVES